MYFFNHIKKKNKQISSEPGGPLVRYPLLAPSCPLKYGALFPYLEVWPLVIRLLGLSFGGMPGTHYSAVSGHSPSPQPTPLMPPSSSILSNPSCQVTIFTLANPRVTLLSFSLLTFLFDTIDLLEIHSSLGFRTTLISWFSNSLNILDSFAGPISSQWLNVSIPQALASAFSFLSGFSF